MNKEEIKTDHQMLNVKSVVLIDNYNRGKNLHFTNPEFNSIPSVYKVALEPKKGNNS